MTNPNKFHKHKGIKKYHLITIVHRSKAAQEGHKQFMEPELFEKIGEIYGKDVRDN